MGKVLAVFTNARRHLSGWRNLVNGKMVGAEIFVAERWCHFWCNSEVLALHWGNALPKNSLVFWGKCLRVALMWCWCIWVVPEVTSSHSDKYHHHHSCIYLLPPISHLLPCLVTLLWILTITAGQRSMKIYGWLEVEIARSQSKLYINK